MEKAPHAPNVSFFLSSLSPPSPSSRLALLLRPLLAMATSNISSLVFCLSQVALAAPGVYHTSTMTISKADDILDDRYPNILRAIACRYFIDLTARTTNRRLERSGSDTEFLPDDVMRFAQESGVPMSLDKHRTHPAVLGDAIAEAYGRALELLLTESVDSRAQPQIDRSLRRVMRLYYSIEVQEEINVCTAAMHRTIIRPVAHSDILWVGARVASTPSATSPQGARDNGLASTYALGTPTAQASTPAHAASAAARRSLSRQESSPAPPLAEPLHLHPPVQDPQPSAFKTPTDPSPHNSPPPPAGHGAQTPTVHGTSPRGSGAGEQLPSDVSASGQKQPAAESSTVAPRPSLPSFLRRSPEWTLPSPMGVRGTLARRNEPLAESTATPRAAPNAGASADTGSSALSVSVEEGEGGAAGALFRSLRQGFFRPITTRSVSTPVLLPCTPRNELPLTATSALALATTEEVRACASGFPMETTPASFAWNTRQLESAPRVPESSPCMSEVSPPSTSSSTMSLSSSSSSASINTPRPLFRGEPSPQSTSPRGSMHGALVIASVSAARLAEPSEAATPSSSSQGSGAEGSAPDLSNSGSASSSFGRSLQAMYTSDSAARAPLQDKNERRRNLHGSLAISGLMVEPGELSASIGASSERGIAEGGASIGLVPPDQLHGFDVSVGDPDCVSDPPGWSINADPHDPVGSSTLLRSPRTMLASVTPFPQALHGGGYATLDDLMMGAEPESDVEPGSGRRPGVLPSLPELFPRLRPHAHAQSIADARAVAEAPPGGLSLQDVVSASSAGDRPAKRTLLRISNASENDEAARVDRCAKKIDIGAEIENKEASHSSSSSLLPPLSRPAPCDQGRGIAVVLDADEDEDMPLASQIAARRPAKRDSSGVALTRPAKRRRVEPAPVAPSVAVIGGVTNLNDIDPFTGRLVNTVPTWMGVSKQFERRPERLMKELTSGFFRWMSVPVPPLTQDMADGFDIGLRNAFESDPETIAQALDAYRSRNKNEIESVVADYITIDDGNGQAKFSILSSLSYMQLRFMSDYVVPGVKGEPTRSHFPQMFDVREHCGCPSELLNPQSTRGLIRSRIEPSTNRATCYDLPVCRGKHVVTAAFVHAISNGFVRNTHAAFQSMAALAAVPVTACDELSQTTWVEPASLHMHVCAREDMHIGRIILRMRESNYETWKDDTLVQTFIPNRSPNKPLQSAVRQLSGLAVGHMALLFAPLVEAHHAYTPEDQTCQKCQKRRPLTMRSLEAVHACSKERIEALFSRIRERVYFAKSFMRAIRPLFAQEPTLARAMECERARYAVACMWAAISDLSLIVLVHSQHARDSRDTNVPKLDCIARAFTIFAMHIANGHKVLSFNDTGIDDAVNSVLCGMLECATSIAVANMKRLRVFKNGKQGGSFKTFATLKLNTRSHPKDSPGEARQLRLGVRRGSSNTMDHWEGTVAVSK